MKICIINHFPIIFFISGEKIIYLQNVVRYCECKAHSNLSFSP